MSRDLPPRPNLDHLRKQAKALLHSMQQHRAEATLADALHAVAREYGFASWPKLKAHVEGMPAPSASLFDRFTEATRRALFFSRYEASKVGRITIAPEHVLLGVIRAAAGATLTLLQGAGITLDAARAATIDLDAPRDHVVVEPVQIPFPSATKALFTTAAEEADRLGHEQIASVHVVLALLRESGIAQTFLHDKRITLDAVRAAAAAAARDDLQ
jgi:hypothetical protein